MTNCLSQLSDFQAQINRIFETFKSLLEPEKHEAITLIEALHIRSLKFVVNNHHVPPSAGSNLASQENAISDTIQHNLGITDSNGILSLNKNSNDDDQDPVNEEELCPQPSHVAEHNPEQCVPHSESVTEKAENSDRKSVDYHQPLQTSAFFSNVILTDSSDLTTHESNKMKINSDACQNPALDSQLVHPNSENKELQPSYIVSAQVEKNNPIKFSVSKEKASNKSMVLRSAKKLKKKAMTKFIYQSDINGQSNSSHEENDASDTQDKAPILESDDMLTYVVSCWFCKKSFESLEDLTSHSCFVSIKERSDSGKRVYVYECLLCRITFLRLGHLRKHLECHVRNVCKICDSRFARQNTLCRHMKVAHNDVKVQQQQYDCLICKKTFMKKKSLHLHLRVHANGQLVCIECGEFFENETFYAQHIKIHFREKRFFCKQCNEFFERRQQFEQHQMGHKRHICSECNVSFPTKKLWQKHQHRTHGLHVEEKKHKCAICQKTFLRPIHLRLHLQTHTGEKPTRCFQCGKNFSNSRTLAMHMKTSSHLKNVEGQKGEKVMIDKPFLCALCGSRFFRQQSLSRHTEQIHSSKTSLKCPHCKYTTKCDANLKRHIKLHTGPKQYVCEKCGSSFHAMATLNEHHAYVHSEKRSFVCNLCTKSFKGKSGLQRHMRIHSEARPYKCHCNRSYKRMSHLKRHISNAHQTDMKVKEGHSPTNPNLAIQVATSESVSSNSLKNQSSTTNLPALLSTGSSFTLIQNEDLHADNSPYDTLVTTADNYLVLPSGDININFMSNSYQTISIPATTSELISENDVPSNILHLPSQSSLRLPAVSQDASIICSESTLDQLKSVALNSDDFHCSKADLSMTSAFPNFSISDGNSAFCTLPISTLLINMDLHSPQLQSSESLVSEMEASKRLFDENAGLLDMPSFASDIHLNEGKDLTTLVAISTDTDSLWSSNGEREKHADSITTSSSSSSSTMLACPSTIASSTSKHNSILQEASDFFSESLLFQNEHSSGCSIDPDALQSDELDSLSSQVYNENVKQLLSIS